MEKIKAIFSGTDVEILERANVKNGFLKVDKIELRHRLFAGGWSDNITVSYTHLTLPTIYSV